MMMDENVAYVSHNTVYRVLSAEGLLDKKNNKASLKGTGFKQPERPHQHWHIDVSYINAGGTFYYLCSILDGYSRFVVHHDIAESMDNENVQLIVLAAKEKSGAKRCRLISDNGSQFKVKTFKSFIKLAGMDQVFTSPFYPQSNGKIERWHKELKQTCIRPSAPRNFKEAKANVEAFVEDYNYKRLHSAIGYVTPYDKLIGLEEGLKAERAEKLKRAAEKRKAASLLLKQGEPQVSLAIPA